MAKHRLNVRFDPELLAGLEAAVAAGRAENVTGALEAAAAAWLGVGRGVPSSGAASVQTAGASGVPPSRGSRAAANGARAGSAAVKAGVRPIPKQAKRK